MEKINNAVLYYQQIIGIHDKQLWERSVEEAVLKSLRNVARKSAKVNPDLIDVDLVRGSTFSKSKPQHGWAAVSVRAAIRLIFLPLYYKWWLRSAPRWMFALLAFLYLLQISTLVIYFTDANNIISTESLSLTHFLSPLIMMYILSLVHTQIMATYGSSSSRLLRDKHRRESSSVLVNAHTSHSTSNDVSHQDLISSISRPLRSRASSFTRNVPGLRRDDSSLNKNTRISSDASAKLVNVINKGSSYQKTSDWVNRLSPGRNIERSSSDVGLSDDKTSQECEGGVTLRCKSLAATRRSSTQTSSVRFDDDVYICSSPLPEDSPLSQSSNGSPQLLPKISPLTQSSDSSPELIPKIELYDLSEEQRDVKEVECSREDKHVSAEITEDSGKQKELGAELSGLKVEGLGEGEPVMEWCERCETTGCDCAQARKRNAEELDECPPTATVSRANSCSSLSSINSSVAAEEMKAGVAQDDANACVEECGPCQNDVSRLDENKEQESAENSVLADIINDRKLEEARLDSNSGCDNVVENLKCNKTVENISRRCLHEDSLMLNISSNNSQNNCVELVTSVRSHPSISSESCHEIDSSRYLQLINDKDVSEDDYEIDKSTEHTCRSCDSEKVFAASSGLRQRRACKRDGDHDKPDQIKSLGIMENRQILLCDNVDVNQHIVNQNIEGMDRLKLGELEKSNEVTLDSGICEKGELCNACNTVQLNREIGQRKESLVQPLERDDGRNKEESVVQPLVRECGRESLDRTSTKDVKDLQEEGDISVAVIRPVKRPTSLSGGSGARLERSHHVESTGLSSCDSEREACRLRRSRNKTASSEWEDTTINTDMTSCSVTSTGGTSASESSENENSRGNQNTSQGPLSGNSQTIAPVMKNLTSTNEKVSCVIWENSEVQKVDLTVLDIGCGIIEKVQNMRESCEYLVFGFLFSIIVMSVPVVYRVYHSKEDLDLAVNQTNHFCRTEMFIKLAFGQSWRQVCVILNGVVQRLFLSLVLFFLLSVAERTFKQRLLYAKNFCYLTSSRRAKKYDLPHFRLNKVRNIKTWLSLRSFLKRRGPQRSVESIVSAAFLAVIVILSVISMELLQDYESFLDHLGNWELTVWCLFLGVFLMRFFTLGTKINKKYRNFSVLITEQINLYLHMEQKPHKKDELMLANSVLKLAEDLLKELESPFKVSGLVANPFLYNITKVVVLSAFSAVLTELLGFKLKLNKIKIRA